MVSSSKNVIGRLEHVDIPEWDLYDLEAKIDTGAYTSSVHCHHVRLIDDNSMVEFKLLDPDHEDYSNKVIQMPVYKTQQVKSSNGISEERIIIKTEIVLAAQKIQTQFSLTDRSEMRYPLLIGRRLLKGRFLVDVAQKF